MKYLKVIIILVILIGYLTTSCESDDICPSSSQTTPSLVIDTYDFNSQENKKNIINLVAVGVGNESTLPNYTFVSTNQLVLPLKTTESSTQYLLIKEATLNDNNTPDDLSDDIIEGNIDTLTVNYSKNDVFVSRACGYKTIFENVTLTIESDSDNWILSQQPLNANQSVENETTHFNIYH